MAKKSKAAGIRGKSETDKIARDMEKRLKRFTKSVKV